MRGDGHKGPGAGNEGSSKCWMASVDAGGTGLFTLSRPN